MSNDVEWGPWVAHRGNDMPKELTGNEDVQTWRVDFSSCYLPDGRGANFEEESGLGSKAASGIRWDNPPCNKMVVAYRVKKEPVVEVRTEPTYVMGPLGDYHVLATCTYTDGKLTKIHWEAGE